MKVVVFVKATPGSEAGEMPNEKLLADMGKYNEELVQAGIMKVGEGLKPSKEGVRMRFSGANRSVTDGPFAETRELVAGFWIWEVRSMQEAIDWVKRCPGYLGWMQALQNEHDTADRLVAIGVHGGGVQPEALRKELANRIESDVTFPICIDLLLDGDAETDAYPGQFFSRCGIRQMPYGWPVGPDGKLIAHGDPAKLIDKARELIRSSRDK